MPHQQQDEQEEEQVAMGGRGGSMNFPSHPSSVFLNRQSSSVSFMDLMKQLRQKEPNHRMCSEMKDECSTIHNSKRRKRRIPWLI